MSTATIAYLIGMACAFAAERLLADHELLWPVRIAAVLALLAAIGLRARMLPRVRGEGLRRGHRLALILLLVGCGSLVLYAGTTGRVVDGLALDEKAEARWVGTLQALWPVVWLLGTIPLLVVDHALRSSPVVMPIGRIRDALSHGLVAAMGIALLFPLNYVASKKNERWDLAYFKTPTPGTATIALAEALEQPVTVRIFMPPSSEVAQELRAYFAPLQGPNLQVEVIDQAANPRLSKALAIRDNGTVALTMGDVAAIMKDAPEPEDPIGPDPHAPPQEKAEDPDAPPRPVTQRITVNADFEKAKRTLKKIDREVQKALIELGQGERVAYLTSGHGELDWSGQGNPVMTIRAFRERLIDLGFSVKQLSLREGLGEKVPDDASVVMILGPRRQFLDAEINALRAYVDRGGALMVALPPKLAIEGVPPIDDPLDGLLVELGVRRGDGVLASERNVVVITHNLEDRLNTYTNSFSSHASSRELAKLSQRDVLFTPGSGWLEEVEGRETDVTMTVRSLSTSWADLDLDAEFDAEGESKEVRGLVAAITGGTEGARWRAVITTAPTAFVDLAVLRFLANQQFADDAVNWLIGAEDLIGTTESEEDVKIEHTKEGQTSWFYGTVLGVPLVVLVLGGLRLRLRRRGPSVGAAASSVLAAAQGSGEPARASEPRVKAQRPAEPESDDEDDASDDGGAR